MSTMEGAHEQDAAIGTADTEQHVAQGADTILINGVVLTQNPAEPVANTVVIRGKRIAHVGNDLATDWAGFAGPTTRVVDLRGQTVIPGIVDSHTHPGMVAGTYWRLPLPWSHDAETILTFLRDYAEAHPPSEVPFIYGEYYPADLDWGPEGPSAATIDRYVSDRPVLLDDILGHASVVNSKLLELIGVDAETPLQIDPEDSAPQFVRGEDGKTPTGWLLEGAFHYYAEELFEAIGWDPPSEVTPDLLHRFTRFLTSKGVTSLFDAFTSEQTLAAASALDRAGKLNMHYSAAVKFASLGGLADAIAEVRRLQEVYGSDHIQVNAVKLFLDGTNEVRTGAVLEPYLGGGGQGVLRMNVEDLSACMLELNDAGVDLHIHVCGDRGFRVAMDAVERAQQVAGDGWLIQVTTAHNELIDPVDVSRPAQLGVILNITPHWVGGEMGTAVAATLGWHRFNRVYDYTAVLERDSVLTFSSDVISAYEADRADPYLGMQIAHTRSDARYPMPPSPGTVPGTSVREPLTACIPMEVLLKGYTINGATQLRLAHEVGSIEAGKLANMSVLNAHILTAPTDQIAAIEPVAVLFEGQTVAGQLP